MTSDKLRTFFDRAAAYLRDPRFQDVEVEYKLRFQGELLPRMRMHASDLTRFDEHLASPKLRAEVFDDIPTEAEGAARRGVSVARSATSSSAKRCSCSTSAAPLA